MSDETKIGTCKHCGDENVELFPDNNRCENCDSQFYPCSICKEEQHEDDHCRHIFQGHYSFEWLGSGAWRDPGIQEPFTKLLSLMPADFPAELKEAILSGKFYTWMMSPLIGCGGSMELNGMPNYKGMFSVFYWGKFLIDIGQSEHAEETADGYHWLASLYMKETPKANRLTVKWINEFIKAKPDREAAALFANLHFTSEFGSAAQAPTGQEGER